MGIFILGAALTAVAVILVFRFVDRAFCKRWDESGINICGTIFGCVAGFIAEMVMMSYNCGPIGVVLGAPLLVVSIMMTVIGLAFAYQNMELFAVELGDIVRQQRAQATAGSLALIAFVVAVISCTVLYIASVLSLGAMPFAVPAATCMYLGMLLLTHKVSNRPAGRA